MEQMKPQTPEEQSVWMIRQMIAIQREDPEVSGHFARWLARRALTQLLQEE